MKVFADSLEIKQKIIDYLKINHYKLYVTPDIVSPLKVVIRGLPANINPKYNEKQLFLRRAYN